jgi:hypothetical protein
MEKKEKVSIQVEKLIEKVEIHIHPCGEDMNSPECLEKLEMSLRSKLLETLLQCLQRDEHVQRQREKEVCHFECKKWKVHHQDRHQKEEKH